MKGCTTVSFGTPHGEDRAQRWWRFTNIAEYVKYLTSAHEHISELIETYIGQPIWIKLQQEFE